MDKNLDAILRQQASKFWDLPLLDEFERQKKTRFKELLKRDISDTSELIILPKLQFRT